MCILQHVKVRKIVTILIMQNGLCNLEIVFINFIITTSRLCELKISKQIMQFKYCFINLINNALCVYY